ncbi:MAG: PorV/PorQ family protein, partial [Candidatus Desantisbacteria bacterium]
MRKLYLWLIMLSMITAINDAYAKHNTGAKCLTFGIGARASGMGEAMGAVADDVSAMYWNPAGLGFIKDMQVMTAHHQLYPDISNDFYHNFIGGVMPLKVDKKNKAAIGAGVIYLAQGINPIMKDYDGMGTLEQIGEFQSRDIAAIVSYGQRLKENIAVGAAIKYIDSRLYVNYDGHAAAIDFGVLARDVTRKGLNVGVSLANYGNKIYYQDKPQADALPLTLRFGIGYRINDEFLLAADINQQINDKYIGINLGIEGYLVNNFIIRAGYFDKGAGLKGLTYGFGVP